MYKVFLSVPAAGDLNGIYDYIAFEINAHEAAERLVDKIESTIATLKDMPSRHPTVDERPYKAMGIRRIYVDNYTVFYSISETDLAVTVIRILYGGRNWTNVISNGLC